MRPLGRHITPELILAHRVTWSVVLLVLVLSLSRTWGKVLAAIRNRRTLGLLTISMLMVSTNWYIFTTVTTSGHINQAALGYFLNPLFSAFLGMLFFRERLRPLQWTAVVIAALGVTYMAIGLREIPHAAILLALTFGLYGLVRKVTPVDAVSGLMVETTLLFPLAVGLLVWAARNGSMLGSQPSGNLLLALVLGCSFLTTIPLLLFAKAARLLKLSTLGFLQYIGPTCQFLCAVLVFGEPFPLVKQISFATVWLAVLIFILDAYLTHRKASRSVANPQPTPIVDEPC